jgi:hypothetical protein
MRGTLTSETLKADDSLSYTYTDAPSYLRSALAILAQSTASYAVSGVQSYLKNKEKSYTVADFGFVGYD